MVSWWNKHKYLILYYCGNQLRIYGMLSPTKRPQQSLVSDEIIWLNFYFKQDVMVSGLFFKPFTKQSFVTSFFITTTYSTTIRLHSFTFLPCWCNNVIFSTIYTMFRTRLSIMNRRNLFVGSLPWYLWHHYPWLLCWSSYQRREIEHMSCWWGETWWYCACCTNVSLLEGPEP